MKASIRKLFANYLSAMSIIGVCYFLYQLNPLYPAYFASTHTWPWFSVTDAELFIYGACTFGLLLPVYYATIPDSADTKSSLVWRAIYNLPRRLPVLPEKVALLATGVKAFFLPLMIVWFFANGAEFFKHAGKFWDTEQFFAHGYWTLFKLVLLIDVTIFTIAYAIEHPVLGNEIKSVEPTFLGWAVAIVCYPPLNGMTSEMLGWYTSDYPRIDTTWLQYASGGAILSLMSVYLWATLALNIKASNLTNRGIVTTGPYAYIRHPAYVCKNLAWWIGAIPILVIQFHHGITHLLFAVGSVLSWSVIYYLRAITEERHLLRDGEYQQYFDRVPGFFPRRPQASS